MTGGLGQGIIGQRDMGLVKKMGRGMLMKRKQLSEEQSQEMLEQHIRRCKWEEGREFETGNFIVE